MNDKLSTVIANTGLEFEKAKSIWVQAERREALRLERTAALEPYGSDAMVIEEHLQNAFSVAVSRVERLGQ